MCFLANIIVLDDLSLVLDLIHIVLLLAKIPCKLITLSKLNSCLVCLGVSQRFPVTEYLTSTYKCTGFHKVLSW